MSTYGWDSEDYAKYSRAQQKWARELIDKLKLNGDETLLDIGSGDGKVTAEIAGLLPRGRVIGVDSAPSMVQLARSRYPQDTHANLSFELMDAAQLSFKERFDLVFSNAVLHWLTDHGPVLDGIFASLKPGGRMLLQMGGEGNAQLVVETIETLIEQQPWHDYFEDFSFPYGFFGPAAYSELLGRSGFTVDRVECIGKDMEHDGVDGLRGWLRTTWLPYTERLSKQKKDVFIDSVVQHYLQKVPLDATEKAHVAMVRLEVEARKPEQS
jgi:trans-aconitate methyltransferase